jgi:hypothetical protein
MRIIGIGPDLKTLPWGPSLTHSCSTMMMNWYSRRLYEIAKANNGQVAAATTLCPGGDEMFAARCIQHAVPLSIFLPYPEIEKTLPEDPAFRYSQFKASATEVVFANNGDEPNNLKHFTEANALLIRCRRATIKAEGGIVVAITDGGKTPRIRTTLIQARTIGAEIISIDITKFLPRKKSGRFVIPTT